ncbi:MAG TPA: flagellar filament capping protein FliD [Solirubrobacteraceae bacterium]|jgi:flagellar hook-associated protein 2
MPTTPITGSSAGAPINITGLASGLNTNEIINALMAVERRPVAQLTNQQSTLQAQQTQLQQIQTALQQLSFSAADLSSPALFETSQTVTSSNPSQITALSTKGAGVGGYEVNVTQLANSAQRTFTFTSPASADTLTIDGQEISVKAGASIQEVASAINSDSNATVYAAALEEGKLVLSNRTTGNTGEGFIAVSDAGGTLSEVAGTAKQGKDAEFTVDGVAGTSSSNTVKNAIAGVTLNLGGLTTVSGPVTIDVGAPGASVSTITAQVESFVKLYNSTVGQIHNQLTTKPPEHPQTVGELGTGTLFGDSDLGNLVDNMRQAIYTPAEGLTGEITSLNDIGVSTGTASGSAVPSQGAVEGELKIDTTKLSEAIQTNPKGVEEMLQKWSLGFQKLVNVDAEPGGTLDARITGDTTSIAQLGAHITSMNEMLEIRQRSLQQQFVAMEAAMSQIQAQQNWLTGQINAITANTAAIAASSSKSSGS